MSAEKALSGFKTETRELLGGMKENNTLRLERTLICLENAVTVNDFYKKQSGKNALVARPGRLQSADRPRSHDCRGGSGR